MLLLSTKRSICWWGRSGYVWAQVSKFSELNPVGETEDLRTSNNLHPCDSRRKPWLWERIPERGSGRWEKQPGQWSFSDQCDTLFQCLPLNEQPHEEFLLCFQSGAPWDEWRSPWANGQWLQELWEHHSVAAEYHQLPHRSPGVFQGKAFQATHLHQLLSMRWKGGICEEVISGGQFTREKWKLGQSDVKQTSKTQKPTTKHTHTHTQRSQMLQFKMPKGLLTNLSASGILLSELSPFCVSVLIKLGLTFGFVFYKGSLVKAFKE